MSDTITQPATQITESDEDLIQQWLTDIYRMNEQMQHDDVRIVRLKIETDALKGDTARLTRPRPCFDKTASKRCEP